MVTSASAGTASARVASPMAAKSWVKAGLVGGVAGVIASMMMAAYAMIASATYQSHGFFTPLYHIASTFIAPTTLMASMQHAMSGGTFYFSLGPAALGAVIHMMIGAMYGAAFGLVVVTLRLRGRVLIGAGAMWGVLVFAISSWIALPIAAAVFSSGDQITHMASMVGYSTFLVEHVLFGSTLGLVLAVRRPSKPSAL